MEEIEIIIDALQRKLRSANSVEELIGVFEKVTSNEQSLRSFVAEHLRLFAADKRAISQSNIGLAEIAETTAEDLEKDNG